MPSCAPRSRTPATRRPRRARLASVTPTVSTQRTVIRLELEGMTCASCAVRIERKLNKLDGVEATVNFATERAAVSYDPASVDVERLIRTVEQTGYVALLPQTGGAARPETDALFRRLLVAVLLTGP